MRSKLGCLSLVGFVSLLAIGAIPVDAGIRPSFSLDYCSWNATHIVLVQTTTTDGVFSVVESWKGDLKPGDSLEVPDLKPNKDAVPISSHPKPPGFDSQDVQGVRRTNPEAARWFTNDFVSKEKNGTWRSLPIGWEYHRDTVGTRQ